MLLIYFITHMRILGNGRYANAYWNHREVPIPDLFHCSIIKYMYILDA